MKLVRMYKQTLLLLWLILFSNEMLAQDDTLNFPPPDVPASVHAVGTTEIIDVDGKLNEPACNTALPIADFSAWSHDKAALMLLAYFLLLAGLSCLLWLKATQNFKRAID